MNIQEILNKEISLHVILNSQTTLIAVAVVVIGFLYVKGFHIVRNESANDVTILGKDFVESPGNILFLTGAFVLSPLWVPIWGVCRFLRIIYISVDLTGVKLAQKRKEGK